MRYTAEVSRLENIIWRDQQRRKMNGRKVVLIAVGALVLVVGFQLIFTDVGMKKPKPKQPPPEGEVRVNDIKLMHAPATPAK